MLLKCILNCQPQTTAWQCSLPPHTTEQRLNPPQDRRTHRTAAAICRFPGPALLVRPVQAATLTTSRPCSHPGAPEGTALTPERLPWHSGPWGSRLSLLSTYAHAVSSRTFHAPGPRVICLFPLLFHTAVLFAHTVTSTCNPLAPHSVEELLLTVQDPVQMPPSP